MLRLDRPLLDAAAQERLLQRNAELQAILQQGLPVPESLANYYRTAKTIKRTLAGGTRGKCMYCEAAVTHVYQGAVEHITPKVYRQDLALTYENMGFCCAVCNSSKGTYWQPALGLIDPYLQNPSEHLTSYGPSLVASSDIGDIAISVLDLNRSALLYRRQERFAKIEKLIRAYNQQPEGEKKALLGLELRREAEVHNEFSFVVRNHIARVTDLHV